MEGTTRLADLMAGLSLVSDLGFARPAEEAMRRCVVATALARRLDVPEAEVADVFWTALLQHIGCTGYAHESARAYGDDLAVNAAVAPADFGRASDTVAFLRTVTAGRSPATQLRRVLFTFVAGSAYGRRFAAATCEVGRETARRLGLGDGVGQGLQDAVEAWNGSEGARGLRGEGISLPARITAVAFTAVVFEEAGGTDMARDVVRERAGGLLDPSVAAAYVEHQQAIVGELRGRDPREALLDAEPEPIRTVADETLPAVAAAIGDIADLKTVHTLGHAAGTARLASDAALRAGLDGSARRRVEVAALLHDIGRVGISNAIWDRPGPLTHGEWEQVRLHAYHTSRILARSPRLEPLAGIAGSHHERLDGTGYHRGVRGAELSPEARILAAADAYDAMTHARAHRSALPPHEAVAELGWDVSAGRLDRAAVDAVVAAAGRAPPWRSRSTWPAGLSDREVEVLRLVARGSTNRAIAARLVVSPRTAEHHVQHIYDKLGVSSRAAAALFAMEHALLE